jgi:hypothetical protein
MIYILPRSAFRQGSRRRYLFLARLGRRLQNGGTPCDSSKARTTANAVPPDAVSRH